MFLLKIIVIFGGPVNADISEIIKFLIENDVELIFRPESEPQLSLIKNIVISSSPFQQLPSIEDLITSINLSRPSFCEPLPEPVRKYTPVKSRKIISQKPAYSYIPNKQKRIRRWCSKEKKGDIFYG